MAQVQQRVLIAAAGVCFAVVAFAEPRFYVDDPLWQTPPPKPAGKLNSRKLSEYYDYFLNTFADPGEHHTETHKIPAQAVNTLGDVPDNAWFTNRHERKPMTREELLRGPGNSSPPATNGPWKVIAGKTEGITSGLTIVDAAGRRYLLKFDPMTNPEMASAADVIGSKAFYAIGYNVPENYIVTFTRKQLAIGEKAKIFDRRGVERPMNEADIDSALRMVPRNGEGTYRALASFFLKGDIIGPFRYSGTRSDDPNDIYPHEHRRDLRGLYVFASWLNHTDTKSINSLDSVVEPNGVRFVRHHLIDFGAILGSDSFMAKSPRNGNEYMFDWTSSAKQFFSFGLYTPKWMTADYPKLPSVGNFESEIFDPEKWKSNYVNPAFVNCLPDDAYWAAKIAMSFSDDDLRTLVSTAQYSNQVAADYVARTLAARRDKIGRTWLTKVLALDNFRVTGRRLAFEDLAAKYNFAPARTYTAQWFAFNNETGERTAITASGFDLPRISSPYYGVEIAGEGPNKSVTVYMRGNDVVGIERKW